MSSLRSALSNDLFTRGLILALIGAVLLIAPYFMHATPLRDMFVGARIVGWFGLVLGLAFIAQVLLRHHKAQQAKGQAPTKPPKKR